MVCFNLIIEMYANDLTINKLSKILHISEEVLHQKIYEGRKFTAREKRIILAMLPQCTSEYLFNDTNAK